LVCCSKTHNADFFSSISEIPKSIWDFVGISNSYYFHPDYLSALAKNHPEIQFFYIVQYDDAKKPVAFSTIQIVNFEIENVQNSVFPALDSVKKVATKLHIFSPKKPFKIVTCGNIFVSGEHGIYIDNNQDKNKIIQQLAENLVRFVDEEKNLKKEVKAFMLKDFKDASLSITDELFETKYSSFNVDPNMILHIPEDWNDFSDYLSAMKTKFRVKAKRALTLSESLEVLDLDTTNIDDYLELMKSLYKSVSTKANFNLANFNLDSFKDLKSNLKENYIIKAYFLDNVLVGFLSGLINNNHLDAHFVGLDYSTIKTNAVYQRILYDYVKLGIDKKLSHINFGRTASEIKSSVGAIPEKLTIYLRHRHNVPNKIISPFIKRIQPTPFAQKLPFKTKEQVVNTQ